MSEFEQRPNESLQQPRPRIRFWDPPLCLQGPTRHSGGGEGIVSLNQLHAACNSRIKYQKVCPLHGQVSHEEIVLCYQYEKDQYVRVDPDELDKLRTEDDRAINVETFVDRGEIDPIHHTDKTYYLVPDGAVAQKPFALVRDALAELGRCGVAQVVFGKKEQLVLVRPMEHLLAMTVLHYDGQVQKPAVHRDDVVDTDYREEEMALARTLVEGLTADAFDLAAYRDVYTERLTQLIEARVEGRELVTPPPARSPGCSTSWMPSRRAWRGSRCRGAAASRR